MNWFRKLWRKPQPVFTITPVRVPEQQVGSGPYLVDLEECTFNGVRVGGKSSFEVPTGKGWILLQADDAAAARDTGEKVAKSLGTMVCGEVREVRR